MSIKAKTKLSVQDSADGLNWLVTLDIDLRDGEQFFQFAVVHRKTDISVEALERSSMAQVREMLGSILGIGDRTP